MVLYVIIDKVRRITHAKRIRRFDFPLKWGEYFAEECAALPGGCPTICRSTARTSSCSSSGTKYSNPAEDWSKSLDEMLVTIAGNAVIPILGRPTDVYRSVRTILIYPSTFFQKSKPEAGKRLGEAWPSGTVILAWDSTMHTARDMRDGKNVAIHEFVHQLDFEDGSANGAPILECGNQYVPWADVLGGEFERHVTAVEKGRKTVLDDYGATNPAEFFCRRQRDVFRKSAHHGAETSGTLQATAHLLSRGSRAMG